MPRVRSARRKILGGLALLVLLGLGALGYWEFFVHDKYLDDPTPPPLSAGDPLSAVEREIARRLEAGRAVKDDSELFERLRQTVPANSKHHPPSRYPARIWFLLFNKELRARINESWLRPTARDREAFAYLTRTLPAAWSLRASPVVRGEQGEARQRLQRRDNVPPALQQAFDTAVKIELRDTPEPWQGVKLLLLGDYTEERGRRLSRPMLRAARDHLGDLQGKAVADVGAGCGPTMEHLRQAVGPEGKVYAVEIDPFMLHVLKSLHKEHAVQAHLGGFFDVRLPPGSVDVITMNGVHLGAGLEEDDYRDKTLPWLKTMARALRPGGLMIIEDQMMELLQMQMVPKVERAGFKKLLLRQGKQDGLDPDQWLAVFKRNSSAN